MNLRQLLQCRHRNRSRPVSGHQECLNCGKDLVVDYSISAEDKAQAQSVNHYQPHERSINRIGKRLLPWRKRK
jgi:hypothetical protein